MVLLSSNEEHVLINVVNALRILSENTPENQEFIGQSNAIPTIIELIGRNLNFFIHAIVHSFIISSHAFISLLISVFYLFYLSIHLNQPVIQPASQTASRPASQVVSQCKSQSVINLMTATVNNFPLFYFHLSHLFYSLHSSSFPYHLIWNMIHFFILIHELQKIRITTTFELDAAPNFGQQTPLSFKLYAF